MPSRSDPGALIVGAGPVGLSAALLLARHGLPVRIVDRNAGPTDLSKALVLWKRTMDTLNPVLPYDRFTNGHPTLRRAVVGFGRGEGAVVHFPHSGHGAPSSAMIPQSETERVLLQRLHELGVDVERGTELTQFHADAAGVTCTLRTSDRSAEVRTNWLLACDGPHSTVRHRLGIAFPGSTVDRRWMLADFEVAGDTPPAADQVVIRLAHGVNAAFPMGGARWRFIADQGAGHSTDGELRTPTRDDVQRTLAERTDLGWQVGEIHWTSEFGVNERQVDQYVHGRVVLIGDAAHVHSPAGGQGMNTGIQDAANVAWKIVLVERGAVPEALVATYDAERHPVGKQVVRKTAALLRFAMAGGAAKAIRDRVMPVALSLPALQHAFTSFLTEDSINYRNGPLADRSSRGRVRSGDGWPLTGPAQAELLLFGDFTPTATPTRFGGTKGLPLTITKPAPDDPRASRWQHEQVAVLVRPDGIVASISDHVDGALRWESMLSPPV
jgi:2-polyprenyl-6-methoxyphenol hydroxylase-like FAD-dependent oxidoreductase